MVNLGWQNKQDKKIRGLHYRALRTSFNRLQTSCCECGSSLTRANASHRSLITLYPIIGKSQVFFSSAVFRQDIMNISKISV